MGDDPERTIPAMMPGIQTMPRERRLLSAGMRLARKAAARYGVRAVWAVAPRESADSISPL